MPDQSLVLEIEPTPHGAIVRCRGRLVAGVTDQMYTQVRALMPDAKHLVLDLTDLTHMDSMGLGVIVRLYVSAKSSGCKLELINIGKRISELLGATHLLGVFTTIGEHNVRMH